LKFKNKFIVIFARNRHFTVDPNNDPDPKIDLSFDPKKFVFALLFLDFIPKLIGFFANQHFFTF
jgi:hypothetical protein